MTNDPVELERLSKAATQGVWEHEFRGGHTSQGEVTCGKHSVITVNGGNFAQWRDAPDDGEAEFKANGDFVCALVNAYRTGQLVPAMPSGPDRYPLRACVWKRKPYDGCPQGEWVLEIEGQINDMSFVSRHTEPLTTPPEEVPGLPSLYASQPSGDEVEAVARELAGHMEGGREYDQMPATRRELKIWSRNGMALINDATQEDAREAAAAAIAALDAHRGKQ